MKYLSALCLLIPLLVIDCPVDEPDPQAAAYSATVLFDGDAQSTFFIRRKVSIGETDEAWRDRICAAISAYADVAGYESWTVEDHEWLVP